MKTVLVFLTAGALLAAGSPARAEWAAPKAPAKAGVQLFVCGQNLAYEKIDPKTLTPSVKVASDALIVLMAYQNDGYALLSF